MQLPRTQTPEAKCIDKFDLQYAAAGIAVTQRNEIVVCELAGRRAHVYSQDGTEIRKLNSPNGTKMWDVACFFNQIYITECETDCGRVLLYDAANRQPFDLYSVGYSGCAGIAVTDSSIYIASSGDGIIYQLDRAGGENKRVFISPIHGWKHCKLGNSLFIAADDNVLAVVYNFHHKLCVHWMDGSLKFQYGVQGSGSGQLKFPSGVVIDKTGNVIVSDGENHRICILAQYGTQEMDIDLTGNDLNCPSGIALTNEGHLVVACGYKKMSHAVAIYQYNSHG